MQPSLAGGEMSPGLWGRVDIARYPISLATCRNVVTKPSGGAQKRPGWRFRQEVKNSAVKTRILPFIYSTETKYLVEAGNLYFRFLVNGVYLRDGSNNIVEVATPYVTADLEKIRITQSADVLYIAGVNGATKIPPKELRRLTADTFELRDHDFKSGPFRSLNSKEAVLMAVSAKMGNVSVTVNADVFNPDMVGSYVYLEEKELRSVKPWEPLERNVPVGVQRRSDGKVYRSSAIAGTGGLSGGVPYYITGNTRPTHEIGRAWDGPGATSDARNDGVNAYRVGVEWEYEHGGYGIVKITGYNSPTSVNGVVVSRIPDAIVGTAPSPGSTWTEDGDGVTVTFPTPGATSPSNADYQVTIGGAPVSPNPYQPPTTGGGGLGGGGNTGRPGDGHVYNEIP